MEILKYKKIKNNMYEITTEDDLKFNFYDETIIHFSLLINKELNQKKLNDIIKYNNDLEAYYTALNYLNKKMRSKLEIENYLKKKDYSLLTINNTIQKLEKEGYLNSNNYIASYINDQINLTMNGPEKIKYNLIKLGFNEEEIEIDYDFTDKITKLIEKKVVTNHKLSSNALRINIANYLVNLGYPKALFIELLENVKANDKEFIQKDYELLLKKYQKKYDSKKLNLYIKDKLYKKGYNIEEINEVIKND